VLPEHYLITPDPLASESLQHFLGRLRMALLSGITLVQLRAKTMDEAAYRHLVADVLRECRAGGARLMVNGPVPGLTGVEADGMHLSGVRLWACKHRPIGAHAWVSAACHTEEDLRQAERIGVDFVTLSPVLATTTHRDAVPMGWERFAELVAGTSVPVYALGGMTRALTETAQSHGATGIAAIRGLW
jgi:thiamine-phosphate pyrophosphorylase